MPGAFQLARGSEELAREILQDPKDLIADIWIGRNADSAVEGLVKRLSLPGYSTRDLLSDVGRMKADAASQVVSAETLIERWTRLDGAVEKCVALTASRHEQFINNTQHA